MRNLLLIRFFCIEAQVTCVYRNGEFHKQGIDQCAGGPDTNGNRLFNKCRGVFVYLAQGTGYKAGDGKAHALFDIDPDKMR